MKTNSTQAIVLRRTNYGEADRILQLLTPEGRRAAIARGVRKEKSRLAGGIELFAVCDVVLGQGKGDLAILRSARLRQFYGNIMKDYNRLQFGYEVLAYVARQSETLDEPEWYRLTASALAGLNSSTLDLRLIRTWFYLQCAAVLGYDLGLIYDTNGAKVTSGISYRYDVSERGLTPDDNGNLAADHIKLLRLASAKPLQALAQVGGIDGFLDDCELTARAHLAI